MNRLDFFKWIGKGATAIVALPLLPVLPKVADLAIPGKPFAYQAMDFGFKPDLVGVRTVGSGARCLVLKNVRLTPIMEESLSDSWYDNELHGLACALTEKEMNR